MTAPAPPRHVAIVPWGDVVEDFLDPIGRTLDDFARRMTGGWPWGYAQALATCGVRATVFVVSRAACGPARVAHEPTGTPLVVLPSPRRHRVARADSTSKQVFARHPYHPSVQRVYQPAALHP